MAAYASGGEPMIALQSPGLGAEEESFVRDALERVLASGSFVRGSEVASLEAELAHYLGVEHVVGVGSGSDALELSLRALGMAAGCRVVTVANAGYYATAAICSAGAVPVLVDVDDADALMDCDELERAISTGVDAVVVTHLYGNASRAEAVANVCRRARVPLVEDCAQSAGAQIGERRAGSIGDIAAMSFYPTKNLAALGDGGAVATSNDELAVRVRRLAHHGWGRRFEVVADGRNSRLDDIQAAVVRARLPHLDQWNSRRREIWLHYRDAIGGSMVEMVGDARGLHHVAHLAVVRVSGRDRVRARLRDEGIATDVHYPIPDHHQPRWREIHPCPSLPVTEAWSEQVLTVPCRPSLTDGEVERVAAALARWVRT